MAPLVDSDLPSLVCTYLLHSMKKSRYADMPHGTDRPYLIRILAFFEMIRPYHVGIQISGNLRGNNCKACVAK